jgi:hypothetical protein
MGRRGETIRVAIRTGVEAFWPDRLCASRITALARRWLSGSSDRRLSLARAFL